MVIGNLTLAKMSANRNKEISDRLAAAETAVLSAKRLTQQLLTFSKGGEPIKAITPTSEFIAEVAQLASISSQILCEVSLPPSLPPVEIDQGMMTQVFTSVITNALQAVGNEGKVKVSGQVQTVGPQDNLPIQAGKYVEISVADNGIGIPEDRLSQIFDPYYTTKPDAAGLGLAIAHSVLIKHDGHIRVESEVGVGTSFIVYIPVSDKELRPARDEKERIESSGGRILVMDDEEMIQNMLRDVLIRFGYDVELAKDGTEAIALYKIAKQAERPFDCVIMDLTIPEGLGGRETIQKLLEMDPTVTAIVSSGYSNDPIMAAYKDYGFKGVVAKPYRVQDMLKTVREVLHTNQGKLRKDGLVS
jgi:CheY-like chemotaxis protein